ncbi:MAG: FAD-dependent oxidoreductase [Peptococcaceae bacterium]|nr:FAD-dependent oxidoreductase [Peptococcaceae bacterium]
MSKRILIVGGVAGGASCAARLRRMDEAAEIVLFERGEYISFANCGLPYYIGGVIPKREMLLVQDEKTMHAWFNIDIHTRTEVTAIQPAEKTVSVKDLRTGEVRSERYDALVLSPGAAPIVPQVPGLEEAQGRIFTIRNIADVDALQEFLTATRPSTAVVVGGGFIGLEMTENLRRRGLAVHLVEAAGQVMAPLDPEMATLVHAELRKNGVDLHLGSALAGFENGGKTVVLTDGQKLYADCTIMAIGVRPESGLIKEAGLAVNDRGAIVVDDQFRVKGADGVYAIGDAIEVRDFIFGEKTQIPLAGPANRMGRMVADIICGKDKHYAGTLGSSVVQVFGTQCATTGKNEKQLRQMGVDYQSIHLYPANHATYYPGASQMSLKVLYAPADGKLYGAQAVGKDMGIDKTIDVIATAIKAGMSVFDLADVELCYAPPFGTAKAPVNFAGYIAENIASGEGYFDDTPHLDALIAQGATVLDVRGKKELERVPMPSTLHIPLPELRSRLAEVPADQPVYVSCMIGVRGHIACRILQGHGIDAINVAGGAKLYTQSHLS